MVDDWEVVKSERLVHNRWITVRRDMCRTGRGEQPIDYYVVEKSDFAMAVAVTTDNHLILVRQYKHGGGKAVLECPAGYIDENEEPIAAVERELREETGYVADHVESLGTYLVSPSFLNNRAHFFLCTGAVLAGPQQLDRNERIEIEMVDFDAAVRDVILGDLELDMASTAAVLLARGVVCGRSSKSSPLDSRNSP